MKKLLYLFPLFLAAYALASFSVTPPTTITAGDNITITKTGSNYEIDASGEISGTVAAGDITAGTCDADVIVSSIGVNAVHPAAVSAGTYSNITLPAANVAAGSLPATVIVSSIALNSVETGAIRATGTSGYLNKDGTWSAPTAGAVAAGDVTAGTLDTDVKVTVDNITATGAAGYLNKDGTWSTPASDVGSVAANAITAGTMDADVIASSIAVNTVGPTQMQAGDYNLPTSSAAFDQITVTKIVTPGETGSLVGNIVDLSTVTYARINTIEFEDGTTMTTAATGSGEGDLKADGTVPMTGDLNMGGQDITNVGSVLASEIVVTQKTDPTKLYFYEGSGGGENKITLKSSATLAGDFTLTLPNADGTADQVIATDGAGNLYFKADATGAAGVTYEQLDSNGDVGTSAGQLAIGNHTHSYQAADDDLTDLADGTLTGSKVGTGIVAANIASGSMGSGVIVSSMSDTAFTGYTGQVVSNGIKIYEPIPYGVSISSPYAQIGLTICFSASRDCAVTFSTMTAHINSGTNVVYTVEQRADSDPDSAGTALWTGNQTATTAAKCGATFADYTMPADYKLYLRIISVSGDVANFVLSGRATKD